MAVRRSIFALVFGCLLVFSAASAFAANGHISGRITRTNGNGIGGVIVSVTELGKATLTDANGEFSFDVPPGTYSVQFVAGEQVTSENSVAVTSGGNTRVDKKVDWNLSIAETITVYSASRRTERVVEAPSAVTVMATEDIEAVAASGQAARIIESAPGVDFTQSGLYDTNFNARGFNSSLNRRILTLIDGRDPAIAFLGAQEWAALSFPVDEMASVELIRGPGSALYGANAFSGVLNMTTKQPRLNQGGRILATGGDLNTRRADIRHAGSLGGEWYYRVVGGYQNSDDFSRSRNAGVEYPGLRPEARPLALDEVNIKFGGLRFDKHFVNTSVFTAEGGYASLEGPVFQTGIGRVQVTDVQRPWTRVNYNTRHWNVGGYYDSRKAEDQIALASGAALFEDSHNLHGELQTNWDFFKSRARVIGGVAWHDQDVDTANDAGVQTLMLEAKSEQQKAAFGQVEFDLTQKVKLVGAARWDDSTLHEAQFSPKGAIVFSPSTNHTFRYGYNEAFQRPNYSELFLAAPAGAPANLAGAATLNPQTAPLAPLLAQLGFGPLPILARGNDALDVEKVKSHEVGYSGIFRGKVFLTVDLYKSQLSDFVTDLLPGANPAFAAYQIPGTVPAPVAAGLGAFLRAALGSNFAGLTTVNGRPALVLSYTNAGRVDTQGGEIAVNYYLTNNWLVDANYAHFDFDVKEQRLGDQLLPNAPANKFNLGLAWRGTKLDAKVTYRWIEEFDWAAGIFVGHVPQYDLVNLSGNYQLTDRFGLGVDVSNLLDDEHYEAFGGDLMSRRALAFVSVNW
ncbi:MAG: iron complex outerrane recepter protein [Acidobacteriota bacterium]|nr:iron complex outerrane recepter protein [Acidobacteriota bacterium]